MRDLTRAVRGAVVVAAMIIAFGIAPTAAAQPSTTVPTNPQSSTSGPVVALDRPELSPGDNVVMTIDGFETGSYVTIAVCGNQARRGSADCNMLASVGLRLNGDGSPSVTQMPVAAPPVPCPCIVRVSSQSFDEIAVAPVTLIGHPTGPLVGGPSLTDPLVAVTISAHPKPRGLLEGIRSSLGGPTRYEATVTVKNLTNELLRRVAVSASVGRGAHDSVATISLDPSGEIGPGQTRQQVVSVKVPAPTFGSVTWRATASGAGPTVTAIETTQHRPVLLFLLVAVFVLDVAFLIIRGWRRRRASRRTTPAGDVPDSIADDEVFDVTDDGFRELVSGAADR